MNLCKNYKIIGKYIFVFLISLFLFQSCKKNEDSEAQLSNDEIIQNLDNKLDSMVTKAKVPGIYLGIRAIDKDLTYEKTKGYSDVNSFRNMGIGDLYRIGNITNSFTTTVMLQLVDENKASLDSTLNKYIPSVPNAQNITIRQLLNMTSGLYDYSTDSAFVQQLKATPLKKWSQQELINYAISHSTYFPPGTGWHYSRTNSILIGMIIEQITGNSLKQEIQNRIISPLNLQNTYFPTDQNMPVGKTICNGYITTSILGAFENVTSKFDPSWIWAAGSMISNSTDMKIWVKELVNGSLLSSTMQQERLKFVYSGTPSVKYGLGIFDLQNGFSGYKGALPGYNNLTVYFPARGTTISIMINLYQIDYTSGNYSDLDSFFTSVLRLIYPEKTKIDDIYIVN